ncbi:MAG: hypothetical protein IT307_11955 [Chloroflexi bacterium]|nr:hypothetical protein [Chloroflexota bacterium]
MANDWFDNMARRAMGGVSRRTLPRLAAAGLLGAAIVGPPRVEAAEQISIQGTIDCGRMSGENCPSGAQMTIITDQFGQTEQRLTIDLSWFPHLLENYSQDDLISLQLSDDSGHWLAVGVVQPRQPAPPTRQKDDDNQSA